MPGLHGVRGVRGVLGVLGFVAAAYGVLLLLDLGWANTRATLVWLVGGVVLHDAVFAPVVLVICVVTARLVPRRFLAPCVVALVVLVPVTLLSVPELGRFGARADRPTLLDRALLARLVRSGHTGGRGGADGRAAARATTYDEREEVTMARVMVVDDDVTVREVVVTYLRAAGYDVGEAADGEAALDGLRDRRPDLVVLDLMLPGIDGLEVCRRIRAKGDDVPVIMLTALGSETDRVVGLERGADDYVTKPFSPRELVLRVESVLRRVGERGTVKGSVSDGDLVVDSTEHSASLAGRRLSLTAREFDLLRFFLSNPGQAFSRDELLQRVWGWSFGDQSTVTVHVRRLREKIERDPTHPVRLATVWGVGYRWEPAS